MAKRRRHNVSKTGAVWSVSSVDATLNSMPRFNGFACGYGAHGDTKYNRAKEKRRWKSDMSAGC